MPGHKVEKIVSSSEVFYQFLKRWSSAYIAQVFQSLCLAVYPVGRSERIHMHKEE
jgi:hypothetical protein